MIPSNITRRDIIKAVEEIRRQGIPEHRKSTKYALVFEREIFPPKYVISIANRYANGEDLPASTFSGGTETNSYLIRLGFNIIELKPVELGLKPRPEMEGRKRERKRDRHTERCPDCKIRVAEMLASLYGMVKTDHRFEVGVLPEDFSKSEFSRELREIFFALMDFRGHSNITRADRLSEVDYYVPDPGFILEFDESQHFTAPRKVSLERYPDELKSRFNRGKWIQLCESIDQSDNDPPYRDEQRAWYDTLRDFLPTIFDLQPTVRLFAGDRKWCELDHKDQHDRNEFKAIITQTMPRKAVELRSDPNPSLGRVIICDEWKGRLNDARQVLHDICSNWPADVQVDCLVTPGAFLTFPWPTQMPEVGNPRNPNAETIEELISCAEMQCKKLLNNQLVKELRRRTNFLSIGIDSFKKKISLSQASIREPHIELVAFIDLSNGHYHWTGKSYPTAGQQDGLVRISDIGSHFVDSHFGKVLILGCHDLIVFSPRGRAVTKAGWRRKIRSDFYSMLRREEPTTVLHHPHTTDSSFTWLNAWNEVFRAAPTILRYIGAGRYHRPDGERSSLDEVLMRTKHGPTVDCIIRGYGP